MIQIILVLNKIYIYEESNAKDIDIPNKNIYKIYFPKFFSIEHKIIKLYIYCRNVLPFINKLINLIFCI